MFFVQKMIMYNLIIVFLYFNFASYAFPAMQLVVLPSNEELSFMRKFGYLDDTEGFEAQYSRKSIREAIINIQRYGGITQSGVMDAKTKELLTKRRCGVKDIISKNTNRPKRFSIMKSWKKRRITYNIASWNKILGRSKVKKSMEKAFAVWSQYGHLSFVEQNDSNADIIISFSKGEHGDSFPFDGNGNVLAHAFYPADGHLGGDMHFDDDENWVDTEDYEDEGVTDFFTVATHELGHSLGLGHSHVQTSIMAPYYKTPEEILTLDDDDIMAMYKLYVNVQFDDQNEILATSSPIVEDSTSTTSTAESTNAFDNSNRSILNICEGGYDTIAALRGQLYIFKGKYMWRYQMRRTPEPGYPSRIHNFFTGLPVKVKFIDAAYQRKDGTIALFSGRKYWVFNDTTKVDYAGTLRDFGISDDIVKINAIFNWNMNQKTYLFSDDQIWRYNEESQTLDEGYPKDMKRWKGIPNGIDAVIDWDDGDTYFFKGPLFWRFDNLWIVAHHRYPLPTIPIWFDCPEF